MKSLKARRDKLAKKILRGYLPQDSSMKEVRAFHRCFNVGFYAAVAEMMPEIEKLVKALDEIEGGLHDPFDDAETARQALTKFKEFMEENNG